MTTPANSNKGSHLLKYALVLAAGCAGMADQDAPETNQSGFAIVQADGATLEATLKTGDDAVRVLVVESEPSIVDVTFDLGTSIHAFRLDYVDGLGDFTPDGEPLDAAQRVLLAELADELQQGLPADETARPLAQTVALRMTSFMAEAPVGELLASYRFVSVRGWTYIGCSCRNQYIGSGHYRVAGVGFGCTGGSGNGCKGRCGAGCNSNGHTGSYTQDCAKHDYGLGSWTSASDDFSFAGLNC
jgi:hypothetical protein